jgi:hypothetical protein
MAVKIFKIPGETDLGSKAKRNFLVTGAVIQSIKGAAFNVALAGVETEESIGNSDYGTPVMDRLEIPEGTYIDLEGNEISFAGIIINTIVFEASKGKNIVKTAIQGRNGKVKEYVSDDDFQINARGFISNKDNVIPLDDLRTFREIMEVPQQIEVISQYLNEVLEVNQIVVENFSMPQQLGVRNELPFTFQASSDVPLDLEELE